VIGHTCCHGLLYWEYRESATFPWGRRLKLGNTLTGDALQVVETRGMYRDLQVRSTRAVVI
jgi:hypothetical protein